MKRFLPAVIRARMWMAIITLLTTISALADSSSALKFSSIAELREAYTRADSPIINGRTEVVLTATLNSLCKGTRGTWVQDRDNPDEFILLYGGAHLIPSTDVFVGVYGTVWCDEANFYIGPKSDVSNPNLYVVVDGVVKEGVLPEVITSAGVLSKDLLNRPVRLSGVYTEKNSNSGVVTLGDDTKCNVRLGTGLSSLNKRKVIICGYVNEIYEIEPGVIGVYAMEMWEAGSDGVPVRSLSVRSEGGEGTVSLSAGSSAGVSSLEVADGTAVSLSAVASKGYEFVRWTVGGREAGESAMFTTEAMADAVYVAHFRKLDAQVPERYDVSVVSNNAALGSVSAVSDDDTSYRLVAVAADGARFVGWYDGDVCLSTATEYSFTPTSDMTIEGRFTASYNVTVTSADGGEVAIEVDGSPAASPLTVDAGTRLVVNATAAEGYVFGGFNVNGVVKAANPLSVDVTEDMEIVAKFSAVAPPPSEGSISDFLSALPGEGSEMMIRGPLTVLDMFNGMEGMVSDGAMTLMFTGVPSSAGLRKGDVLASATGYCKKIHDVIYFKVSSAPEIIPDAVPADVSPEPATVGRLSDLAGHYVSLSNVYLRSHPKGGNYLTVVDRSVSGMDSRAVWPTFPVYLYMDIFRPDENAAYTVEGYVTVGNYDDDVAGWKQLLLTTAPRLTQPGDNRVAISVSVSDPAAGRAWIEAGDETVQNGSVDPGSDVVFHAEPNDGWEFEAWLLASERAGTDNPMMVTVTVPVSYTALFRKVETPVDPEPVDPEPVDPEPELPDDPKPPVVVNHRVSLTASAGGSVDLISDGGAVTSGSELPEGTSVTMKVAADENYHVVSLTVNGTPRDLSADGTLTLTVDGAIDITVLFERDKPAYALLRVACDDWVEGIEMGQAYIDTPGTFFLETTRNGSRRFHAEPAEGCRFVGWRYSDSQVIVNTGLVFDVPVVGDLTLVAVFDYIIPAPRRVTVSPSDPTKGTVTIDGGDDCDVTTRRYLHLSAAASGPDHTFTGWTDTRGVVVSTDEDFCYTSASAADLTANFKSAYFVSLRSEGEGRAECLDPDGQPMDLDQRYDEHSRFDVVVTSEPHHELSQLTVNGVDLTGSVSDGRISLTLTGHTDVVATFAPALYEIVSTPHAHGHVDVYTAINPDGTPAGIRLSDHSRMAYGSTVYLFPIADDGYRLKSLHVGTQQITPVGDAYVYVVDGPMSVSADFEAVPSGIDSVMSGDRGEPTEAYDLNGRRVSDLRSARPGIYLVHRNGRWVKVLIR